MKIKKICLILAAVCGSVAYGMPDINNPMTRAVLEVYEQQLKENPEDYHIWLNRANEYYRNNEYMRALNDVDNALKFIPVKETADRLMALSLRANIYLQTDRLNEALVDLNTIVSLDPTDYVAIYQRGNTLYSLGDYAAAKTDYQRLMRLNSRSAEGLVGLARVAVKENNLGTANEMLEQAVANDPSNADLYVRRASVRRDMGNDQGAVEDLIVALAVDSRNNRAMVMLIEYGRVNYPAVIAGLTNAMSQAPNVSMYPYLRAVIAQHHYHYKAALTDFRLIIDKNLDSYPGIWRSMAECLYAMGRFEEALTEVDQALAKEPASGESVLLRAKILRALGRNEDAKTQAARAVALMPGRARALNEMGLVYVSLEDYKQAAELFAESTLTAGDSPDAQESYLLRAWMLFGYLNQPVAAKGFYEKVYEIAGEYPESEKAQIYGCFGQAFAGNEAMSISSVESVLNSNRNNPYIQYLGACFYAQLDDFDKAYECASRSLESGYANYYDWEYEKDARVNVAPLRDDLRFLNLLDRYKHLWE